MTLYNTKIKSFSSNYNNIKLEINSSNNNNKQINNKIYKIETQINETFEQGKENENDEIHK